MLGKMRRWKVFAIGKTNVYLHPAMLLYLVYAYMNGSGTLICISLMSIMLHEGAHAVVSSIFGSSPDAIEITPLGAVMRLEDDGRLPVGKRTLMILAGPIMTFLMCIIAARVTHMQLISLRIGRLLFSSNLSILLINSLPVLPLDGGRLLSMLLSAAFPAPKVRQIMQCIGSIVGIGLIGLNIYVSWETGGWNLSLAFAGCCVLYSASVATITHAAAELHQLMERKIKLERKGCIAGTLIFAMENEKLRKLIRLIPPDKMAVYICLRTGDMKVLGHISEYDLIQHYLNSPDAELSEVAAMCQI